MPQTGSGFGSFYDYVIGSALDIFRSAGGGGSTNRSQRELNERNAARAQAARTAQASADVVAAQPRFPFAHSFIGPRPDLSELEKKILGGAATVAAALFPLGRLLKLGKLALPATQRKALAKVISDLAAKTRGMTAIEKRRFIEQATQAEKRIEAAAKRGAKVGPVGSIVKTATRAKILPKVPRLLPLPLPISDTGPKRPKAAAPRPKAGPGAAPEATQRAREIAATYKAAELVRGIKASVGSQTVAAPVAPGKVARSSGATAQAGRDAQRRSAAGSVGPLPAWLTVGQGIIQRLATPSRREGRVAPAPESPFAESPGTGAEPQPLLTPFGLGGVSSPGCDCTGKRKKGKKRKPRALCNTGTYTETATGLIKRKKRKIPCRPSKKKPQF